jgi:hypothetical protein
MFGSFQDFVLLRKDYVCISMNTILFVSIKKESKQGKAIGVFELGHPE